MTCCKALVVGGFAVAFLLLFVVGLYKEEGIKAVSCVEQETPALNVEVTAARRGGVDQYRVLGCTFYAYHAPWFQA
jgi:hypothetical protein